MDISKILNKIASTPDLLANFQESESFQEVYNVCKKADPNITQSEFEKIKQELINTNNDVLQLGDKEINMVTGG